MSQLGFAETIAAFRAELINAMAAGADSQVHFPVGEVTLDFHVGVTRSGGGKLGVKFWVLELGADVDIRREEIHKVTVVLRPPVDAAGRPVQVFEGSDEQP